MILVIFAIVIYLFSFGGLIISWRKYKKAPKGTDLILHIIFIIVFFGYQVSISELVKSKRILVAQKNDSEIKDLLILRDNGECEFQTFHNTKVMLWKQEGSYKISGDTIDLTVLPYTAYFNRKRNKLWYLNPNQINYNIMDTIYFDILTNRINK
jgi:hypothetical protein